VVNGNEEIEFAFIRLTFSNVNVKITDRIGFETFLGWFMAGSGRRLMPYPCKQQYKAKRLKCGMVACKA
jgi:hypothetical protein